IACLVRTITAFTTSPFFTVPSGAASLIWALITSPIPAYIWFRPITPIAAARFAPVLSATSKIERICNILTSNLSRATQPLSIDWRCGLVFLDDLHQTPGFGLREWPRFGDQNNVAHFGFVFFVVRVEFLERRHDLLESRMLKAAFHADNNRLVHLVRNHFAGALFAVRPFVFCRGLFLCLNHIHLN